MIPSDFIAKGALHARERVETKYDYAWLLADLVCCCFPEVRPFKQCISTEDHDGPVMMTVEKPVDCFSTPQMKFYSGDKQLLGSASMPSSSSVERPWEFCWQCSSPHIEVKRPDGSVEYHVHAPVICGGLFVDCWQEGCGSYALYIYKPENDFPGQEIGKIIKVWSWWKFGEESQSEEEEQDMEEEEEEEKEETAPESLVDVREEQRIEEGDEEKKKENEEKMEEEEEKTTAEISMDVKDDEGNEEEEGRKRIKKKKGIELRFPDELISGESRARLLGTSFFANYLVENMIISNIAGAMETAFDCFN